MHYYPLWELIGHCYLSNFRLQGPEAVEATVPEVGWVSPDRLRGRMRGEALASGKKKGFRLRLRKLAGVRRISCRLASAQGEGKKDVVIGTTLSCQRGKIIECESAEEECGCGPMGQISRLVS